MLDYHIAVPTFGRVGRVRVFESFPDATLYVPESQAEEYSAQYGAERVRVVPDSVEGNLARKLNWMLERTPSENWLRIDDDVDGLGVWDAGQWRKLTAPECTSFVSNGFRMCRESGSVFWGVNIIKDKRAYSVFRPIKLLAPVLGPFNGHCLPHGLKYDERMGAKEDYDFWLQVIARYRRTWRFDKYHYLKREEKTGGWYSRRTMDNEREWATRIVAKWGKVIRYDEDKKNLLDGRVAIPISGC